MADARNHNGGARRNAGRKPRQVMQSIYILLDENWSVDQRAQTVKSIAEKAAKGDLECAKFLFDRYYGKPRETHAFENTDPNEPFVIVIKRADASPTDALPDAA